MSDPEFFYSLFRRYIYFPVPGGARREIAPRKESSYTGTVNCSYSCAHTGVYLWIEQDKIPVVSICKEESSWNKQSSA